MTWQLEERGRWSSAGCSAELGHKPLGDLSFSRDDGSHPFGTDGRCDAPGGSCFGPPRFAWTLLGTLGSQAVECRFKKPQTWGVGRLPLEQAVVSSRPVHPLLVDFMAPPRGYVPPGSVFVRHQSVRDGFPCVVPQTSPANQKNTTT